MPKIVLPSSKFDKVLILFVLSLAKKQHKQNFSVVTERKVLTAVTIRLTSKDLKHFDKPQKKHCQKRLLEREATQNSMKNFKGTSHYHVTRNSNQPQEGFPRNTSCKANQQQPEVSIDHGETRGNTGSAVKLN